MTNADSPRQISWHRSRYAFAGFWLFSLLFAWFVLRVVLFVSFKPAAFDSGEVLRAFFVGFQRDLFVATLETVPLLIWFLLIPNGRFSARWHRVLFGITCFVLVYVQIFLLCVEFFFFEEFKSRFNTVAVDYLLYPYEVFVNIWQSYHVGIVSVICLLLTFGWVYAAKLLFAPMWERPFTARAKLLHLAAALALAGLLAPFVSFKGARVGTDRTLNELANSGAISFMAAAWTRNLDYAAFYKTLPKTEAYQRARQVLAEPNTQFVEDGLSIRRQVAGDSARPRLNLVILLEESLGSEFWGCLGRSKTLTPEMDKLAATEGMLFTDLFANGNRTVRGMEGVLSSFPSLPGDSIVKRNLSDNVETLARVLKRDGYSTVFLYGGRGVFDGMRSFAVRNGFERFVEQKHFPKPTFTTAWGVCDEDLMSRTVAELRALSQTGKPFFATVLSVSNHKPYTYPTGRIPEDPAKKWRRNAVKYADYALGQFFNEAKKEAFWTNTIFAVVADHGARVYGKESIPIHSYEIPLLVVGPAVVKEASRISQVGCSLDVGPTLLGMIGRPYESLFFGRDLLKIKPEDGRVFLNHNRDIGMLAHDRLIVLGLMQTVEFYHGNPKEAAMNLLTKPEMTDLELEKDAIAVYQVADDLYTHQKYHLDDSAGIPAQVAARSVKTVP